MSPISRGFTGRRPHADATRLPPGQYLTRDFPVLSAGPTPHTPLDEWTFLISGAVDHPVSWTWEELRALSAETPTVDIHCVTKWSKLDTRWTGVVGRHPARRRGDRSRVRHGVVRRRLHANLPLEDLTSGKAWIAYEYDGTPLEPEHGGPARLLVPHLYFWKSAKWIRGLTLSSTTSRGSGRPTATTTTATRGGSSAIRATGDRCPRPEVAARSRPEGDRGSATRENYRA